MAQQFIQPGRAQARRLIQGRQADMRIVDDHEVSKSEQVTRFVCGALLGVVFAVAITYKFDVSSLIWKTGIALVSILGCGILALVQGDRFWLAIFGSSRLR